MVWPPGRPGRAGYYERGYAVKMRNLLQILEFASRLGLGVLFIYSALAKISDPDAFAYSVSRYRVLPDFMIGLFSLTMPMLEFLTGLSMLFTRWLRESALLVAGMLALFIVALVQALARGLNISCGCFGVPSVGGRSEILIALVRDVVLIVPAIWLMFRPNTLIEPWRRISRNTRMICLCGFGMLFVVWLIKDMVSSGALTLSLSPRTDGVTESEQKGKGQGLVVSSGPIRPGEWNADFNGVRAKAEREQCPMVLVHVGNDCGYCARLEECIAGESFRQWREDRAPLMAFVREGSPLYSPETVKASHDFAYDINKNIVGVPFVCVYWPQCGITNRVAFSGRRGTMGGEQHALLVMQLMSALDNALKGWRTTGQKSLESMVSAATVQISVRAEGSGGTVAMDPADGLLPEGKEVKLIARPDAGYAFVDWRRPDGSLASQKSHMAVPGGMPVGCYTARFRIRSAEELKTEADRREMLQQMQQNLRRQREERELHATQETKERQ